MKNVVNKFFIQLFLIVFFLQSCKTPSFEIQEVVSTHYSLISSGGDTTLQAKIAPYREDVEKQMNIVISQSNQEMIKGQPQSILGNFVADMLVEYAQSKGYTPQVSLMNNGGLRAPLPKGEITVGNIFELMPFENEIVIVTLNKEGVQEMLQYILHSGGVPFSGIKLLIKDEKLASATFKDGSPILDDNITLVTTDYLLDGGDKMGFMRKNTEVIYTQIKLRDAIIDFCKQKQDLGISLNSKLDDRIKVWSEGNF